MEPWYEVEESSLQPRLAKVKGVGPKAYPDKTGIATLVIREQISLFEQLERRL